MLVYFYLRIELNHQQILIYFFSSNKITLKNTTFSGYNSYVYNSYQWAYHFHQ